MNKDLFLEKIEEIETTDVFKFFNLNNYSFSFGEDDNCHLSSLTDHYSLKNYNQFLQRIGLNCPIMTNEEFLCYNKDTVQKMINKVLLEGPEVYAKCYCRNNEILACHSKDYKPLKISELIDAMQRTLSEEYENFELSESFYSDEFTIADFRISDRKVVKAYQNFFGDGQKFYDAQIIVRMVTSNLGLSGANLYPVFFYKTNASSEYRRLPITDRRICLEHKGNASIKEFEKNCRQIFPLVEMLPEELASLDRIEIEFPTHCVINLAEKVNIPAKRIKNVAEDVSFVFGGCKPKARELYQYFATVIDEGESEIEKMQLTEKVAKALRILKNHTDDVDIPKTKWKRLGVTADEGQDFIPDADGFGPQLSFEGVA